ncbi:G/U mismatch-specific uracil DNA glycosylase [Halenospora varia]|nr:G/U mismatch-specific uracil DNA glycosylase [Halenospora varia]
MDNIEVKQGDVEEDNVTSTSMGPASFAGKLDLSNFAFAPKDDASPRRSPRNISSYQPPPISKSPSKSVVVDNSLKRSNSSSLLGPKSSSPSPRKKSRSPSGYAPPSKYAHLPPLGDVFDENLILIFIGLNPGITTSTSGHAYAHPSNLFYKLLHSSGITARRLRPEEDGTLPADWQCGFTNIVPRPTKNGSELSKVEMDANVTVLDEKMRKWKPEAVCIVGKSIWESIYRVRKGRGMKKGEFEYGWQEGERMGAPADGDEDENWEGARIFVASSTSGLAATLSPAEKERIWNELGGWVKERREERT